MRLAKYALALLGLATALWAADPFVGTWKLSPTKSKFKDGQTPQPQTVTIQQQGDQLDVRITGTMADGTPFTTQYAVPVAGGEGAVTGSPVYDMVASKRIDEYTRENTYTKAGKQVMTARVTASKDGRALRVRIKGLNPKGEAVEGIAVYDKQ